MGKKQGQEQAHLLARILAGQASPQERSSGETLLGEGGDGAQILDLLSSLVSSPQLAGEMLGELPAILLQGVLEALVLRGELEKVVGLRDNPGPRGVQKAAGQTLHRLATRGVEIPRGTTKALIQKVEEAPAAWASFMGLEGERSLDLFLPGSDATLRSFILSEDVGIRDTFASEVSRTQFARILAEARDEGKAPPLPVPFPHALFLLEEALAQSTRAHRAVDLQLFTLVQHLARDYPPRLCLPPEVTSTPPLTGDTPPEDLIALLTLPPVMYGWRMRPSHLDGMFQALEAIRSAVVIVSPEIKKERLDDVIRSGVRSFFTPERRRQFKRRLEELAVLLPPDAAFVLPALGGSVAALAQEEIDILNIPFATGFVQIQFYEEVRRLMPARDAPPPAEVHPEPPPLIITGR